MPALESQKPREAAIPVLLRQEGGRLYQLGRRLCGNDEDASDLVQETFLQAFRKWHQFEGRSRPSTWLYTIAVRICRRMHRLRAGEPEKLESLDDLLPYGAAELAVAPARDDPAREHIRKEAIAQLESAIAALPIAYRVPIILKEIVGLSVNEVAIAAGIPPGTVKSHLHRGRLMLRRWLEGVLPRKPVPAPEYSRQVCLDLLHAKQNALDCGRPFPVGDEVVSERCLAVFESLDFVLEACADVGRGALPPELARTLERTLAGR